MAEQDVQQQRSTSTTEDSKGKGIVTQIDDMLTSQSGTDGPRATQGGQGQLRIKDFFPVILVGCLAIGCVKYLSEEERLIKDPTQNMPRLAHVVSEVQGTRRINLIGGAVMTLTGIGGLLTMMVYRHIRKEKARVHDSMFWFLAMMSLFSGCLFILWRWRRRKHDAVRNALHDIARTAAQRNKSLALAMPAVSVLLVLYLLYLRRQSHVAHQQRRKRRHLQDKAEVM